MTLWGVCKRYGQNDEIEFYVMPYNFIGHLRCCIKWFGIKGMKNMYLTKKQANKVAEKKNKEMKGE